MLLVSFMLVAQKIIFRDVFTSVPIHLVLVVIHLRYLNNPPPSQPIKPHSTPPKPPRLPHLLIVAENHQEKNERKFLVHNLQSLISSELKLKSKL